MNYVTTNIRLPEEDYLRLKDEAARSRKSLSAVIREKVGKKRVAGKAYAKLLLSINTDWFSEEDYKSYKRNRVALKKRLNRYNW